MKESTKKKIIIIFYIVYGIIFISSICLYIFNLNFRSFVVNDIFTFMKYKEFGEQITFLILFLIIFFSILGVILSYGLFFSKIKTLIASLIIGSLVYIIVTFESSLLRLFNYPGPGRLEIYNIICIIFTSIYIVVIICFIIMLLYRSGLIIHTLCFIFLNGITLIFCLFLFNDLSIYWILLMFCGLIFYMICLLLSFNDFVDIDENPFNLLWLVSIITGFYIFFINSKYIFFDVYKILTIISTIVVPVLNAGGTNIAEKSRRFICRFNLFFKINNSKVAYHLLSFHCCNNCKHHFYDEKNVCKSWTE